MFREILHLGWLNFLNIFVQKKGGDAVKYYSKSTLVLSCYRLSSSENMTYPVW